MKPSGREVFIASFDPKNDAEQRGTALWKSPDAISAMAWTNNTIAAVRGSRVTFIVVPTGAVLGDAYFDTGIRTID